ncbi:MAG: hypothetical protein IJK86_00845 [Lachnospiraceae bacterium]|nr:hypothetical protein [Lachnospiraceae bacterium]
MGQFFERILIQDKGFTSAKTVLTGIPKAARALGYEECEQGKGVPLRISMLPDSEWFDVESPLLESASETAAPFLDALVEISTVPVLTFRCEDSDFVICRLQDKTKEIDTVAYLGMACESWGEPDYEAWAAACKKKWKCKAAQFQTVFEDDYVFAEEGLTPLSNLLHFSPPVLSDSDPQPVLKTFWFLPADEAGVPARPRTLLETAADYMEEEYAQSLTERGFCRFGNSPLRWHKVIGEKGNEILLSFIITTYHGYEYALFYGSQSLYCPVVFSDKYYPYHDEEFYWKNARFEFYWKMGWSPVDIKGTPENGNVDIMLSFSKPEMIGPFIEQLILPELDEIADLESCHEAFLHSTLVTRAPSILPRVTRFGIESILLEDEKAVRKYYEIWKKDFNESSDKPWYHKQFALEEALINEYEAGGIPACKEYLEKKVYQKNIKKLQKAGVI